MNWKRGLFRAWLPVEDMNAASNKADYPTKGMSL
jgi:hypothetical protein